MRYNANIPIYGLVLVMQTKNIALVFRSFMEIQNLISDFFYPLKLHAKSKYRVHISVPSLGKILWLKMRYVLHVKLGALKVLQTQQYYRKITFCKLILLARNVLI